MRVKANTHTTKARLMMGKHSKLISVSCGMSDFRNEDQKT
jgi:hypothetical protein